MDLNTNLENIRKLFRGDIDDAVVHELDHCLQIFKAHIFEDDNGMLAGVDTKQGLKVVRASGK